MSKAKSVRDEYRTNKSTSSSQNQHIKYVPVDDQFVEMYPYEPLLDRSSRRTRSQCCNDLPRTYYVPVSAKHQRPPETLYKHLGMNSHYKYYKPCPNYFLREPIQNTLPNNEHPSIVYLKYPKQIGEENPYYEQIQDESGDYNREQDYYEYDDPNMKYYETERKYDHTRSFLRNDEFYYDNDYIPQTFVKNQSSKTVRNANYFLKYMETNFTELEKKSKYFKENKLKSNKVLPQKINTKVERCQSFLEPVKNESLTPRKIENKKDKEISTLYEKIPIFRSNNNLTPTNKTCTVSCQTSSSGNSECLKELKECFSKCTQTLQLDFTENKVNLRTSGTQTLNDYSEKSNVSTSKKTFGFASVIENRNIFTESMDKTNYPAFSMEYLQLSKSRTNSFLCPETTERQNTQNKVEPFVFTATTPTARPEKNHSKFSSYKF